MPIVSLSLSMVLFVRSSFFFFIFFMRACDISSQKRWRF